MIPFIVFDRKRDYRHLKRITLKEIIYMRWSDFKFNPLLPPKMVSQMEWYQILVDVFAQAFGLMVGSKSFLIDALYHLSIKYNNKIPSLFELRDYFQNLKIHKYSRDARFLESCFGRLNALLLAAGSIFDCSVGFPIEELIKHCIVIELDGLAGFIQNFIELSMLMWIFSFHISNNLRGSLRLVIFSDEAKKLYDGNFEKSLNEISTINWFTSIIREFGIALVVSDQEPSKLSSGIKANSFTKIGMSLRNGTDIINMAHCMSLNKEQMDYFNRLSIGQAIVRTGKHEEPFTITIPLVPVTKDVSDEELYQ